MWEDIAGRGGRLSVLRALRRNIIFYAPNSADAFKHWQGTSPPDAWIIYNIRQIAYPSVAQVIPLDADHLLYRDCDISLTVEGKHDPQARVLSIPPVAAGGAHLPALGMAAVTGDGSGDRGWQR